MKLVSCFLLLSLLTIVAKTEAQVCDTMINIGKTNLHFRIIHGRRPSVLLEHGGGLTLNQWDSIAISVKQRLGATVITYDRQGAGKSRIDTSDYSLLTEIKNLQFALKAFRLDGRPLLIVGHSLGAFYCRLYAARHPKEVKGILLLDPRIPGKKDMAFARSVMHGLNRAQFTGEYSGLYQILAKAETNSDFLRHIPIPEHIPVVVMMAGTGPFDNPRDNERFKNDERQLVKGHHNRKLIFVKNSTHNIPHDRPNLVVSQLTELYEKVFGVDVDR